MVGLFTGMSVLSLMELLFWFCRGVANCFSCKRRRKESKEEDGGEEEEGEVDKVDAETPSTAVVEVPMVGEMEEEEEGRRLNTQSQI